MPETEKRHCVRSFLECCAVSGSTGGAGYGAFTSGMLLADMRSPKEFLQGHIPGAVNIPLFDDAERAEVGTLYKNRGKMEALLRGLSFTGPKLENLVRRFWEELSVSESCASARVRTKKAALYCSRGGMRSGSTAWLLGLAGIDAHVLEGGYKAFRRYTLEQLAALSPSPLYVLGGKTGSGKTEVLRHMARQGAQVLDLEALARHRGSVFGALPGCRQPSQEHFENLLAMTLRLCDPNRPLWVEDECENLGSVNIPKALFQQLRTSPLVVLDLARPARLTHVLQEYGAIDAEAMREGIDRIKKRLGGLEHQRAHAALRAGDLRALADLLLEYYDRAYAKQMHAREPFAVFREDALEEAAQRLMALTLA